MPLEPGSKLGQYEVLSSIGAGGMGEVYRARDTKLGREVAIKLLLEEVSSDPERLARFEREARVLASLNHPHIATLYGYEREGETSFLVMELVEGETLADRIARGPLAVEDAISVFTQIAEGLEVAHAEGVIHRDLKPANVKLSDAGDERRVKILDFGLAKALAAEEPSTTGTAVSESPTLTLAATMRGEILGTAAYMSPEQASGRALDKRTDIWAFGVCLYEALTGRRLFEGDDAANTLAAVLRDEIDLSRLPECPRALHRVLQRCLVRDRRERLHDIGDARIELQAALAEEPDSAVVSQPGSWRRSSSIAAVAAIVASLLTYAILRGTSARDGTPRSEPVRKVRVTLPDVDRGQFWRARPSIDISPDGSWIALVAYTPLGVRDLHGRAGVYVRRIDSLEGRWLPDSSSSTMLFWGPGPDRLTYDDGRSVFTVTPEGGIASGAGYSNAWAPMGLTWLSDGTLVVAHSADGETSLVARADDLDQPLIRPSNGKATSQTWPSLLPGGTHLLYNERDGDDRPWRVRIGRLADGSSQPLAEGRYPRYTASGHVIFARNDVLHAVAVGDDWLPRGETVPVVEGVVSYQRTGAAQYAVSQDGTLIYAPVEELDVADSVLVWVDRQGVETTFDEPQTSWGHLRLSVDGAKLVAARRPPGGVAGEIYLHDFDRGGWERLTHSEGGSWQSIWLRGRDSVAYLDARTDGVGWFIHEASGARNETRIGPGRGLLLDSEPGGGALVAEIGGDLVRVPLDGSEPTVLLETPDVRETAAALSPDGRWIAYQTDRDGRWDVVVRPYPALADDRIGVSLSGGNFPAWSHDGRELFFWQSETLMAASARSVTDLAFEDPRALFANPLYNEGDIETGRNYDVARDGRFILPKRQRAEASFVMVTNWFEELERLAPTE